MFLLENLRQEKHKIIVAHINYKKRIDSDWDEKIVRDYCQKYSLPLEIYQAENANYFFKGNFQDKARKTRYISFQKLADKYQTKYIAVAHHFDDHLETYLLQKQRKSLVDYWGLPNQTKLEKYWILRPLLSFTKQQIINHLNQKRIDYATDSTNQLPIYQRNIIRKKLTELGEKEKLSLQKEIFQKNKELKKIKLSVKKESQKLITSSYTLQLKKASKEESSEIHLRLLYLWVNQSTNGLLQQRKKKLLAEIYKQLFISKKNSLIIELGRKFQVIKSNHQATILPKNN
jgi:tRNA(Ile)-lysidine synthase